jgi:hypothetical protein
MSMDVRTDDAVLGRLTPSARSFVCSQGVRMEPRLLEQHREAWIGHGVPVEVVDRAVEFQRLWGGLVQPPGPFYDGGPRYFDVGGFERSEDGEWLFEVGPSRTAVPYGFMIGPGGAFGIATTRRVPLHGTIEGWIESLSLAHDAFVYAERITRYTGVRVETIDFTELEPIEVVAGVTDSWWRGDGVLVACSSGEAEALDAPQSRVALRFTGDLNWLANRGVP